MKNTNTNIPEFNTITLEDCLVLLGSKKPFFNNSKTNSNGCIEPFTISGNVAYEKLRSIIKFLIDQNVVKNFDEDLLDTIADEKYY